MTKAQLDEWWGLCDFKTMEFVTGYCQHTFSPEDGYQDFVDACDINSIDGVQYVRICKTNKDKSRIVLSQDGYLAM